MYYTGTSRARDRAYLSYINGVIDFDGTSQSIDGPYLSSISGIVIGKTYRGASDGTFIQEALTQKQGLQLDLYDRTYVGGSYFDGTYSDGTYLIRTYDPVWINYSIRYLSPPDGSDQTVIGYGYRTPLSWNVGRYYANMMAPVHPGRYEIHWLYQKDQTTDATKIIQGFSVSSWGISSTPDYS